MNIKYLLGIIIFFIILTKIIKKCSLQLEHFSTNEFYSYKSPLKNIVDDQDRILNVCFINYPFTDKKKYETFLKAKKKGMYFIGISSYINFPCITENKYDITSDKNHHTWKYNYFDFVIGWFHCFRNPDICIPKNIPKELISESDFSRYENYEYKNIKKEYDFIYICLKDNDMCTSGWQSESRNWDLAKKCIDIMCNKYKLKGLLIGRINCKLPKSCHQLLKTTDFLKYHDFMSKYNKCSFIFLPNILDASPRVLTEALCHNLPCLVNKNIVGGWKYVNKNTGEFFSSEKDFENSLKILLNNMKDNKYSPRKYFINNHGVKHEGKRIIEFIKKNIPNYKETLNYDIDKIKYLRPVL